MIQINYKLHQLALFPIEVVTMPNSARIMGERERERERERETDRQTDRERERESVN